MKRHVVFVFAILSFFALLTPCILNFSINELGLLDSSKGIDFLIKHKQLFQSFLGAIMFVLMLELMLFALLGDFSLWYVIHLPFFAWLPAECFYIYQYGAPSSAHVIAVISETNFEESLGFIGGWGPVFGFLIYFFILLFFAFLFHKYRIKWCSRSRWWVISSFSVFLLFFVLAQLETDDFDIKDNRDVFFERGVGFGFDQYAATYPVGLLLRVFEYSKQLAVLASKSAELTHQTSGLKRNGTDGEEIYVVMIGESSRADHWGIAGYFRDTTPLLNARDDVFFFTNMVSASAATRTAVPVMLSRTRVDDLRHSKLKNSWITDFKAQGFKVYWLSTQMPVGSHDTMIGVYASLADDLRYLNQGMYKTRGQFDEVLLKDFQALLEDKAQKKKLIILHTLGSHKPYHFRYPQEFSIFKPVPSSGKYVGVFDSEKHEMLVNAYDNSILYTDYVLNSVLNILDVKANDANAFFWYLSDHGQTLFDQSCDKGGHGFYSEFNFRVPALFWASDAYLDRRQYIGERARVRKETPMRSEDLFETMLDLGGFEAKEQFNGYLSSKYQPGSRMVTIDGSTKLNFDAELAGHGCSVVQE